MVNRERATPPYMYVQVRHTMWPSFTRPSPALVLQATNAGARRPGYEATITPHTHTHTHTHIHKPARNLKNPWGSRRWLQRPPPALVNIQLDVPDTEPHTPLVVDGRDNTGCQIVPVWWWWWWWRWWWMGRGEGDTCGLAALMIDPHTPIAHSRLL